MTITLPQSPMDTLEGPTKAIQTVDASLQELSHSQDPGRTANAKGQQAATVSKPGSNAELAKKLFVAEVPFDEWRESCKMLMRVLTAVAELHPFASIAVGAFNAVIKIELTRRENHAKVVALYTKMNDMMSVLTCLKDIRTEETILSRLSSLSAAIAGHIQESANTVNVYIKSRSISRLFRVGEWAQKFEDHVETFHKHKIELQQELTIIAAANSAVMITKLEQAADQFQSWGRQVEAFVFFRENLSPKDAEVVKFIQDNGGKQKFLQDEGLMNRLLEMNQDMYPAEQKAITRKMEDSQIVDDLKATWDHLFEIHAKEMKDFTSKFDVLKDDMRSVFQEELRAALPGHPRDALLDADIQEIWQTMGWKRQVKSRNFVIALRDHFQEITQSDNTKPSVAAMSRWALQYMTVSRLQSLMDSFDEDGSGFVTVKEVNDLTLLMSTDWSLPECLVYWSAGYHLAMIIYSDKIFSLIAKMHEEAELVLPENRVAVNEYLLVGPTVCDLLVSGVHSRMDQLDRLRRRDYLDKRLTDLVARRVRQEVDRLDGPLRRVKYYLDDPDTLALYTGPGRIEMHVLPAVYLILKHHCRLISLAKEKVLHENEFWDAADTMLGIEKTLKERIDDLKALFQDQGLDADARMQSCCAGLFSNVHSRDWSYQPLDFSEIIRGETFLEDPDLSKPDEVLELLKYGVATPPDPTTFVDAPPTELVPAESSSDSEKYEEPPLTSFRVVSILNAPKQANPKIRTFWLALGALVIDSLRGNKMSWNLMKIHKQLWSRYLEIEPWFEETWLASECDADEKAILERVLGRKDLAFRQCLAKHIFQRQIVHCFETCKNCEQRLQGTQYQCLTCKTENEAVVELCGNCVDKEISGDFGVHTSTHSLLHIRIQLYGRPQAGGSIRRTVIENAIAAQPKAEETYHAGNQVCASCTEAITHPFWYCISCDQTTFICARCQVRDDRYRPWLYERAHQVPLRKDTTRHHWSHTLVQCHAASSPTDADAEHGLHESPASDKDRLKSLEDKIGALEARIASLEKLFIERLPRQ